jgi:hypothetical protein
MDALIERFRKLISTGYDFHKLPGDPGRDPDRDIRRLVIMFRQRTVAPLK